MPCVVGVSTPYFREETLRVDFEDDVRLNVLGCRADILGHKILKIMMWGFMSSDVGLTY